MIEIKKLFMVMKKQLIKDDENNIYKLKDKF